MKISFEVEADHPFDLREAARKYVDKLLEQRKPDYPGASYTVIASAPAVVVDRIRSADDGPIRETWEQSFYAEIEPGTRRR